MHGAASSAVDNIPSLRPTPVYAKHRRSRGLSQEIARDNGNFPTALMSSYPRMWLSSGCRPTCFRVEDATVARDACAQVQTPLMWNSGNRRVECASACARQGSSEFARPGRCSDRDAVDRGILKRDASRRRSRRLRLIRSPISPSAAHYLRLPDGRAEWPFDRPPRAGVKHAASGPMRVLRNLTTGPIGLPCETLCGRGLRWDQGRSGWQARTSPRILSRPGQRGMCAEGAT